MCHNELNNIINYPTFNTRYYPIRLMYTGKHRSSQIVEMKYLKIGTQNEKDYVSFMGY